MITKRRFKEKRSFSSAIFKFLSVLFILAIISFLVISNFNIYQKRGDLVKGIDEISQKIKALEEKNREIRDKISRSQSQEYLEEVAFEKLNFKPIGAEVGAVIPLKENSSEEEEIKKEKNFWQKILETLGF